MVSREQIPIVLTVGLYLGTAVTSNYNLGFRHLLPVLPFLLLPVAGFVARLALARWAIPALLLVESLLLAPLWMSSTNTWWLGRHNPTRLAFSAGELEYMQNFRSLARAARGLGAEGLTVFYPLLDQRVLHAYLAGARLLEPGDEIEPGWYAVSVLIEQYVPAMERATPERLHGYHHLRSLSEQWRSMLEVLVQGEDHGLIAGTFRLYYLDPAAGTNPEAARPAEAGSSPAGWQGTRLEAPPRGRYTG